MQMWATCGPPATSLLAVKRSKQLLLADCDLKFMVEQQQQMFVE